MVKTYNDVTKNVQNGITIDDVQICVLYIYLSSLVIKDFFQTQKDLISFIRRVEIHLCGRVILLKVDGRIQLK